MGLFKQGSRKTHREFLVTILAAQLYVWAVLFPTLSFALCGARRTNINTHKQQIRMAIADCFIISRPPNRLITRWLAALVVIQRRVL